jgi:hypothetical protein
MVNEGVEGSEHLNEMPIKGQNVASMLRSELAR